jgi:hypothetical protein
MDLLYFLLFWWGFSYECDSTFRKRNDGTSLPKSICETTRRRAFLIGRERALGSFNIAVGYVLVLRVGAFDVRSTGDVLAAGLGAILLALLTARAFGRFHGGNFSRRFINP